MKNYVVILWEWRFIIGYIMAGVLFFLMEREKGMKMIYAGIAQAKRYAKDQILKNGTQQEAYVVKLMLEKLPLAWRIFLGEDIIRRIVKWLYNKLGDYMDNGVLDESYKL